jgi:hypothetical protein
MPNDGGHLLLSAQEAAELARSEPAASGWIRPFVGAEELINGNPRACLWLVNVPPADLRKSPSVLARIEAVRTRRLESSRAETRALAKVPALFGEIRQPATPYLAIPKTSSERRDYIPIAYLASVVIASTEVFTVPDATLYHFGVLTSAMHMAWMRQVCGRLESRYRYSNKLVYNNFPWPEQEASEVPPADASAVREAASRSYLSSYHESWDEPEPSAASLAAPRPPRLANATKKQAVVEAAAKAVLDARSRYPTSSLADLYDPLTMPADLVKAHAALDRAVDRCYRTAPFTSDRQRVEFLFSLYETLTAPLLPTTKTRR